MIDDEDSRIRRNLVLVSSSIIAAAWLDLPAASLFGSILPSAAAVPAYKFWALGLTLLAYLTVRYRFGDEGKAYVSSYGRTYRTTLHDLMLRDVALEVEKYNETKKQPSILYDIERALAEKLDNFDAREGKQPMLAVQTVNGDHPLRAVAFVTGLWIDKDGNTFGHKNWSHSVNWSRTARYWLICRAAFLYLFYTETGVRQLTPVLIGLAAEVVIFLRIIDGYVQR